MTVISMSYLLEAGVHFGHQKRRWNPKMREYIFTSRDDIYIIDLQKTSKLIEAAYNKLQGIVSEGGKVIFVGTKKQASEAVLECANRVNMYYMNQRWLGGTLTNFKTIRSRIKRLEEIEKMEADGTFELLPKKEVSLLKKEYDKLNKCLCGIREMDKLPQAMIVVDPTVEINAIKEAKILGIPVIGLIDTNGNPDVLDYVIPCNEDAVRSIKLVLNGLTNAIASVNGNEIVDLLSDEDKKKELKKEAKKEAETVKSEDVAEANTEKAKVEIKEVEETVEEVVEKQVDIESLSVTELKEMAKLRGIKGYSKLKKDELIEVLK